MSGATGFLGGSVGGRLCLSALWIAADITPLLTQSIEECLREGSVASWEGVAAAGSLVVWSRSLHQGPEISFSSPERYNRKPLTGASGER